MSACDWIVLGGIVLAVASEGWDVIHRIRVASKLTAGEPPRSSSSSIAKMRLRNATSALRMNRPVLGGRGFLGSPDRRQEALATAAEQSAKIQEELATTMAREREWSRGELARLWQMVRDETSPSPVRSGLVITALIGDGVVILGGAIGWWAC